jgi:hypothetical protein
VRVTAVDRRLVREQCDPLATQEPRAAVHEHVETRFDARHTIR